MARDFWDNAWRQFQMVEVVAGDLRNMGDRSDIKFLESIGDVQGLKVLDLGCGNGLLSVYLARKGAEVTAVDESQVAVDNTKDLAKYNQVQSLIKVRRFKAQDLSNLGGSFDLVVGRFILHHIEPFSLFAEKLENVVAKNGRGIFLENNSHNGVLLFFRKYLVGRFGIPKYGDAEEYPFEPKEINILRDYFTEVNVDYPEFLFFRLLGSYVFKQNKRIMHIFEIMDDLTYDHFALLRKYSYRQIIEVRKY